MGVNRGKTNEVTRRYINELIDLLPEGSKTTTDCICRKVNESDHRRRYNTVSIGIMLREQKNLKREGKVWIKEGMEA